MIRAIVFFVGRVQGVGFRYNAKEISRKYSVRGTVENCDDGRVKIVVEAESEEIERFLDEIRVSMPGHIQKIDRFESEPSYEFENFTVKR